MTIVLEVLRRFLELLAGKEESVTGDEEDH